MTVSATGLDASSTTTAPDELRSIIRRACELLPAQGPITAFVFLNTLQALEDLPFDAAVKKGARLYGCRPYLTEEYYRDKLEKGRILASDLAAVLREDLAMRADERVCGLVDRFALRLAMVQYPLRHGPAEELRWFVAETDALTRMREELPQAVREQFVQETRHWVMRDLRNGTHGRRSRHGLRDRVADLLQHYGEASIERWTNETWESVSLQILWRMCRDGVHGVESHVVETVPLLRHRDVLWEATGVDVDVDVHEVLIRFCAAFTDQGFAPWPLPDREHGFFRAFLRLHADSGGSFEAWQAGLAAELQRVRRSGMTPLESVRESLQLLGVERREWDDFLTATILALRGWVGLLHQMEVRGDRVAYPVPEGTVVEFLAVRLILERLAASSVARSASGYDGPLDELRGTLLGRKSGRQSVGVEERAFLLFQTLTALGISPAKLTTLTKTDWTRLFHEVESFHELERRRILHHAFERRYRVQALDAVAAHARPPRRVASPRFQAVFCIDAREESFRRHLEETAPDVETFAAPGFFCVPIYYRGAADAHFQTLCPIVVRPQHWLIEEVAFSLEEEHQRRVRTRKAIGAASHGVHVGSRSVTRGALLTAGFGVLSSIPLVARVLFPRMTASIRRRASKFVETPRVTRLRLERTSEKPSPDDDGIGFTVEEMANFGERVLRDIGLTSNFARLVFFLGHGSSCLNNPHKSVYDCGACSGGAGGPNARALAAMLNDPRARAILETRGLKIPADTYFLGGQHNTGNDVIELFDLDLLPAMHRRDLAAAQLSLVETCERNAHERCRRFDSAPLTQSRAEAVRHVEGRTEDLAQTRPEFGNATNAMCFVGRRSRLRGLYMDRRAFMHSYDPTQDDDEATILERILGPVVVVCSGINLQYFFSYVDNGGWGCGTKLPHNITSLLGVMDGYVSDLRSGLPWQGVEIHEPMRLLFVFETRPEAMFKIMERNPLVGRILRNGWGQLALLNPDSSQVLLFRDGAFHPHQPQSLDLPHAASSIDWYRGWRDHLGFAQIGDAERTSSA